MKNHIFLLFILLSLKLFAQAEKPTKIYIARHAEKVTDDPKDKDPELTEKGKERALALAKELHDSSIDAVYATNYKRTRATAAPTATIYGKEIQLYDAKNLKNEAATIIENNIGKTILIVGHSNTVLEMIEAFGGKRPIDSIADQEYNNVFLLLIYSNKKIEITSLKYGAPNSNNEGPQMMH